MDKSVYVVGVCFVDCVCAKTVNTGCGFLGKLCAHCVPEENTGVQCRQASVCVSNQSTERENQMADRVIFVCILVLTGVYFWATSQIPTLEIGDPLGPKAFPRLLGGGLIIAAVMLLAEMIKERKSAPVPVAAVEPQDKSSYKVIISVIVVTGLYFVLFEPLGYAVATSLFLLVMTHYFNKGKLWTNVLTSVIYGFASYYIFTTLLGVNLPRGILPF
jgi:putative tricarboxylic transport membrane protein